MSDSQKHVIITAIITTAAVILALGMTWLTRPNAAADMAFRNACLGRGGVVINSQCYRTIDVTEADR